jgi:hypothetical protein
MRPPLCDGIRRTIATGVLFWWGTSGETRLYSFSDVLRYNVRFFCLSLSLARSLSLSLLPLTFLY